jgi:hypothetical protein
MKTRQLHLAGKESTYNGCQLSGSDFWTSTIAFWPKMSIGGSAPPKNQLLAAQRC